MAEEPKASGEISRLGVTSRVAHKLQVGPEFYAQEAVKWRTKLRQDGQNSDVVTPEWMARREAVLEVGVEKYYKKTMDVSNLRPYVSGDPDQADLYQSSNRDFLVRRMEAVRPGDDGTEFFVIEDLDEQLNPIEGSFSVWHKVDPEQVRAEEEDASWKELPLLRRDGQGNVTGIELKNLKERVALELIEFFNKGEARDMIRETLVVEKLMDESAEQMMKGVMKGVDAMWAGKALDKQGFGDMAQYLSWSFNQATEQSVEDEEYKPATTALEDVRDLYKRFKSGYGTFE